MLLTLVLSQVTHSSLFLFFLPSPLLIFSLTFYSSTLSYLLFSSYPLLFIPSIFFSFLLSYLCFIVFSLISLFIPSNIRLVPCFPLPSISLLLFPSSLTSLPPSLPPTHQQHPCIVIYLMTRQLLMFRQSSFGACDSV